MKNKQSAGILLFRIKGKNIEVFLVHPGGPFWKNKDAGSWSIPKGEFINEEEPLHAACREFEEETGYKPDGNFIALNSVKQKSGKQIYAWACEGKLDTASIVSNTVTIEWPPKTNKKITFPEVDKGEWFNISDARIKINAAQISFLNELESILKHR